MKKPTTQPATSQAQTATVPPHNLSAEISVLGAILQDPAALGKVRELLSPHHFYREAHQKIYTACQRLFERNEPVDLVTLSNELKRRGELDRIGGDLYLTTLVDQVSTAANVVYHAKLIREEAMKRELILLAKKIEAEGRQNKASLVATEAKRRLDELLKESPDERTRLLTAGEILEAATSPDPDWLVDNLLPHASLSVLAGRPKAGKSTLARALAVAVVQGRKFLERDLQQGPVLLISFEVEGRKRDVARHLHQLGLQPRDPLLVATQADSPSQVQTWIEQHKPILVIVDTLARLIRLRDIAAYTEVIAGFEELLQMARGSGTHILLLHHAPKRSDARDAIEAPLGSIAIAGTADTLLHLKRLPDETRTLTAIQRVGEDLPESVITLKDGWPVLAGTRQEHQARQVAEEVIAFLKSHGEATQQEMLNEIEGRTQDIVNALKLLLDEEKITRSGTGRRGDPYKFALQ